MSNKLNDLSDDARNYNHCSSNNQKYNNERQNTNIHRSCINAKKSLCYDEDAVYTYICTTTIKIYKKRIE